MDNKLKARDWLIQQLERRVAELEAQLAEANRQVYQLWSSRQREAALYDEYGRRRYPDVKPLMLSVALSDEDMKRLAEWQAAFSKDKE
jgi:hypothetical protein